MTSPETADDSRGRELPPLSSPPESRPRAPSEPCEGCGSLLDPLRAPRVLAFEDGYRFLCSAECERDFRLGARQRRAPTPVSQRAATLHQTPKTGSARVVPLAFPPLHAQPGRGLWLGLGGVSAALVLGFFAGSPALATGSAVCSCLAAGAALWTAAPVLKRGGWLSFGLGPAGAMLAALSARAGLDSGSTGWLGLEGAALAALAVVARAWLDQQAREPVEAAVHRLVLKLPARVHVPVASASDPLAMALQLVEVESIRTGEEVIAMRGETLAVDGVVRAGEARVLPYPGATAPVRRAEGDCVLAGAIVVEGGLRVLASRVGDDRSLMRITRFGDRHQRDGAPLSRLSAAVAQWGGVATLALALAVALLGPASPLAAAASVLLAAPLLSLRRAAEAPLRAAAAMAAARGIVFHSAGALDAAGRASVVAMSPHGVLTESRPEVVELHALDLVDSDALIAVATAAERATGNHPIARALERFSGERGLPDLEVRRPVHHPGKGVTAISPQGQPLVIGSRRLLLEEGVSVAAADAEAARAEASERTPIFIALDGRVRAVMTLHYEPRVGARPAVQRMYDLGLEVVLLTGDQRGAVQALGAGLDIEHVKAELLPEERGHEVRSLRDAGGTVVALGRPGEDDSALAAADAAIVLAAAGGAATEHAVALVSDDVRDAAAALFIARAARDSAWRAAGVAGAAFALVVAAAAAGLIVPGIAAVIAVAVDAYCLPAGTRLLRRIALRLPERS